MRRWCAACPTRISDRAVVLALVQAAEALGAVPVATGVSGDCRAHRRARVRDRARRGRRAQPAADELVERGVEVARELAGVRQRHPVGVEAEAGVAADRADADRAARGRRRAGRPGGWRAAGSLRGRRGGSAPAGSRRRGCTCAGCRRVRGEPRDGATGASASACSAASVPSASPRSLWRDVAPVDLHEPQHRVGLVAGQLEVDEGDAVAGDVLAAAHVDGHHGLERSRVVAAAEQEVAQRAGADREHGIVDARAPPPAHGAQVVDRARGGHERAVGRGGAGHGALRRPRDRGTRDRAAHPQRRARVPRQPERERGERRALACAVRGGAREARARRGRAAAAGAAAGSRRRRPRPRASGRAARRRARARRRRRPCSGAPCRRCPRARHRAPGRSTCPTAGVRAAAGPRARPRPPARACRRAPSWMWSPGRSPGRPPRPARAGRAGRGEPLVPARRALQSRGDVGRERVEARPRPRRGGSK